MCYVASPHTVAKMAAGFMSAGRFEASLESSLSRTIVDRSLRFVLCGGEITEPGIMCTEASLRFNGPSAVLPPRELVRAKYNSL